MMSKKKLLENYLKHLKISMVETKMVTKKKLLENYLRKMIREEIENNELENIKKHFSDNGFSISEYSDKKLLMKKQTKTDRFYINIQKDYMGDDGSWFILATAEIEVDPGRSLADPKAKYRTTSARAGVKNKKIKESDVVKDASVVKNKINSFIKKINSTQKYNIPNL